MSMMNREQHQQILTDMGITVWKQRDNAGSADYWIVTSEKEWQEDASLKTALIERMTKALQWDLKKTQRIICSSSETHQSWQKKLAQNAPQKVLLFGSGLATQLGDYNGNDKIVIAVVDSLEQLLEDPKSKKTAWQIMQTLIDEVV